MTDWFWFEAPTRISNQNQSWVDMACPYFERIKKCFNLTETFYQSPCLSKSMFQQYTEAFEKCWVPETISRWLAELDSLWFTYRPNNAMLLILYTSILPLSNCVHQAHTFFNNRTLPHSPENVCDESQQLIPFILLFTPNLWTPI